MFGKMYEEAKIKTMFYLFILLWHKKLSLYTSKDFNACKERKKAGVRKKESERERERD